MPNAYTSTGFQGSGVPALQRGQSFYTNSDGEVGIQSGRITPTTIQSEVPSSWVQVSHPLRSIWVEDELKQRASYIGTRRHLAPFIIPHRFEGNVRGEKLERSQLAYSIGLNNAYLAEITGHIRNAAIHYTWGKLGQESTDTDTSKPPVGQLAKMFWDDATGDGRTWTNFFEGTVLEWMLTSPGGLILIDSNKPPQTFINRLLARQTGTRASLKFVPFSWVEDYGRGPRGYRWLKLAETEDEREPKMDVNESGFEQRHILYQLKNGVTTITRWDDKGKQMGSSVVQTFFDMDKQPILPMVPVCFGEHPDISHLGAGLLSGLDDIVIDLYNLLTEVREAYRDSVFTFLAYRGSSGEEVKQQLADGSRFVQVGDDNNSQLQRIGAEGNEVEAGLRLIDMGLKNWALSAKRRAMEITQTLNTRSGTSLRAEFQLDLVPLLVAVTEKLDAAETETMFLLAQMEGFSVQDADLIKVRREKDFQMEQEATRIARIATEFLAAIPGMPAALMEKLIMRWAGSLDFLNMDETVDDGAGAKKPLKDVIEEQAKEIAESDMRMRLLQNQLGILGSAGTGAALGGNKGGGGAPKGDSLTKALSSAVTGSESQAQQSNPVLDSAGTSP